MQAAKGGGTKDDRFLERVSPGVDAAEIPPFGRILGISRASDSLQARNGLGQGDRSGLETPGWSMKKALGVVAVGTRPEVEMAVR